MQAEILFCVPFTKKILAGQPDPKGARPKNHKINLN